jgi:glycosyltransferase involved in cell wall biosynthesis
MIKVLYIIDSLKAYGAEKSLVLLATSFTKVKPVFVILNNSSELKSLLDKKDIKVYTVEEEGLSFKKAASKISTIVKYENPHILHSTLFKSDQYARYIIKQFPDLVLVGSLVSNSYSKRRYKILTPISRLKLFTTQLRDRFTVGRVDHFISNSSAILNSNSLALGIPKSKIKVICRGREFMSPVNGRAHPSISGSKKTLISVGRLCKNKGQEDLVKAFKNLDPQVNGYELWLVGDGPYYERLEKLISDLDLVNQVKLLGYRNDVSELLERADYFIFPSYFEGLSGALIEAVLAKKPCIVSNIPENRECFPDDGGLFFEPGNIEDIESKLSTGLFLENWNEKVKKNYEYAIRKFSLKRAVENYETFYQSVIS